MLCVVILLFNVEISEAVCCCCGTLLVTDATWKIKFILSNTPLPLANDVEK